MWLLGGTHLETESPQLQPRMGGGTLHSEDGRKTGGQGEALARLHLRKHAVHLVRAVPSQSCW